MKKHLLSLLTFSCLGLLSVAYFGADQSSNKVELNKEILVISKEGVTNAELKNEIRNTIGFDYKIVDTFNGITEGYKLLVNEDSVSALKELSLAEFVGDDNVYELSEVEESNDGFTEYSTDVFSEPLENNSLKDMGIEDDGSKRGENTVVAILDSSFNINHKAFADLDSSTNIRLTEDEVTEIKSNASFHAKNALRKNDKIPFYYDYGGTLSAANYSAGNYTSNVEDTDVQSLNSEHGMHVASIATANGEFEGVAKDAQLVFMKVFADVEGTSSQICMDSMIVNALNDAELLGVDAINLSLGSDLNEFTVEDNASAIIFNRLVEKGVTVSVAAGNSGKDNWRLSGAYNYDSTDLVEQGILGSYAVLGSATTVAASTVYDDSTIEASYSLGGVPFDANDQIVNRDGSSNEFKTEQPFTSLIPKGEDNVALEYVVVPGVGSINNSNVDGDIANLGNDYEGIDVTGKIAVIKRGELSFATKIKNAKAKGAIATIIYNDTGLGSLGYFDLTSASEDDLVPSLCVGKEIGEMLVAANTKVITVGYNRMAYFSSDGVTGDLSIKPEITAPGQNIAGAINVITDSTTGTNTATNSSYAYLSGTSMASPNYLGVAASLLGSRTFETEEERTAFAKTIKARLMSTADPYYQSDGVTPISVRKQGAGVVNYSDALNGLYLTANDTTDAKVELKNNSDIAEGIVDFDVVIHNENKVTGTFNSTLSVTVPSTTKLDSETYTKYAGVTLQTTDQRLVAESTSTVTLTGDETQTVNVHYEITDEDKEEILATFANGIQVEGFFSLDPQDESSDLPTLSIPYLGFIGNYDSGDAVEPFDFEKETGQIYQSDLMNSCLTDTGISKSNADWGSTAFVSEGGLNGVDNLSEIWYNNSKVSDLYTLVRTTKDDNGMYHLYAGNEGYADTITFIQFVNRSVKTNVIYLKDSNGKTVLEDHMFDNLLGSSDDEIYYLYKSRATTDLVTSDGQYIIGHRAYTIIPLEDYSEGTYTLEFNYTLMDDSVQTKTYILEIDKDGSLGTYSTFSVSDDNVFTLDYTGTTITDIICEGATSMKHDDDGVTIDLGSLKLRNGISFKIVQENYGYVVGMIERQGKALLLTSEVEVGSRFTMTTKEFTGKTVTGTSFSVSVYNSAGKKTTLTGKYTVLVDQAQYELGVNESNFKVYDLSGQSTKSNRNCTMSGNIIKVVTDSSSFVINGSGSNGGDTGKKGCGGSVVATSVVLSTVALAAGGLTLLLKKSSKKKED